MTIPRKSFDSASGFDLPPSCEFELGGRWWHVKAREALPYNLTSTLNDTLRADEFFPIVLVREEVPDFLALIKDPSSPLTFANVQDVVSWVTSEITKRPIVRPSSSDGGPQKTGTKSRGASSSRATPRKRSSTSARTRS